MDTNTPRMARLLSQLDWSQDRMAEHLGVSQGTIWRISSGRQPETGPISKLLDLLEQQLFLTSGGGDARPRGESGGSV